MIILAVAGIAAIVSTANAIGVISQIAAFGMSGTSGGQFMLPRGVAVDTGHDASEGDVYVADQNDHRIEKFDAAGDFLLMFGREVNETKVDEREAGNATISAAEEDICSAQSGDKCKAGVEGTAGEGQFGTLGRGGAAVDPTTGDVYAADGNHHRIQKFTPEGRFELMFGSEVNKHGGDVCKVGEECQAGAEASTASEEEEGKFHAWPVGSSLVTVSTTGTVYVGGNERVQEFDSEGKYEGQIALTGIGTVTALALNGSGDIYVASNGMAGVKEYTGAGTELSVLDGSSTAVGAVATDSVNGRIVVVDNSPSTHLIEYEANGNFVAESLGGLLEASSGLAVSAGGTIYASDSVNSESGNKVVMFGAAPEKGVPPPAVETSGPLLQDGIDSARVDTRINPHFLKGSYFVEYGPSQAYGTSSPDFEVTGGVTNTPQDASVLLENLVPETEYHYRFVAQTSSGTTKSADSTFMTDPIGNVALPDGRIYEQVTPAVKNGNFFDPLSGFMMGVAEAGGDAVLYPMSGAVGDANSGIVGEFVSRHLPGGGWTTTQATSRPDGEVTLKAAPSFMLPSADFAGVLFGDEQPFASEESAGLRDAAEFANIFVTESVGYKPPETARWITAPQISNPVPMPGVAPGASVGNSQNYVVAGASPSLGKVYFAYAGTLLPEDVGRAAHVGSGLSSGLGAPTSAVHPWPWGFYEWDEGALREAGTLPDGELSAFGAIPAALGMGQFTSSRADNFQAGAFDNVVSADGSRSFFVSPDPLASTVTDPEACAREPVADCTSEAPQLYVRELTEDGTARVALVSQSQLPGSEGIPSDNGVASIENVTYGGRQPGGATYAFASPDGSQVFFASVSRLTVAAPENDALKEYDYNVETGAITYLPGVEGSINVVGKHGQTFMFVTTKEEPWLVNGEPWKLKVWQAGPNGGTVTSVATLPEAIEANLESKVVVAHLEPDVRSAHVSTSESVFVFSTNAPIEGFNDQGLAGRAGLITGSSGLQVYRFDSAETKALNCLSCPPRGVPSVGDAYMSYDNYEGTFEEVGHQNGAGGGDPPMTTEEARGMSANGSRVFFDTRSALVPQATNGRRDVYEWENGAVYLISSGSATTNSYYLDNSESGDDVFFATAAQLVPGDTDDVYDVYDARVPRAGDASPPAPAPCKASACQSAASNEVQLVERLSSEVAVAVDNLAVGATVKAKPKREVHHTRRLKRKRHKKAHSSRVPRGEGSKGSGHGPTGKHNGEGGR
jgi:hypothetical protein